MDFAAPQRSVALYSARFYYIPAELWPGKVARTLISTLEYWDGAIGVIPGSWCCVCVHELIGEGTRVMRACGNDVIAAHAVSSESCRFL